MRIGILTFHKVINYGAYLQAFSLSNKLQKQFSDAEVEIVDYVVAPCRKYLRVLWNIKHYGIKSGFAELKKISIFNSVHKYLPLSPKSFYSTNLKAMYSYIDNRYDILIIGSDAVFNWNQTKFPTAFVPDYPFTIPVYTYAASVHGLRFYNETNDKLKICGKVFDEMKCIGVRDACSEKFVKTCTENAGIIHCCDPTLFINQEDIYTKGIGIKEKIEKKYGFSLNSKYIVVMAPNSTMIEEISKRYGKEYKIISVFVKSFFSDLYIYDLNPFEWAVVLKQAAMVVTSYFHGTLLSLVQGTPAIVLDYSGYCDEQYESKLRDLMITRLNIPELYFDKEYAVHFNGSNDFYNIVDELLNGNYTDKISDAIANERKTFNKFIEQINLEKFS